MGVWATLSCLVFLLGAGASAADKRDVVREARASYYSLQTQGLSQFQCNLTPNWDALLADTKKTNPVGADRAISMLQQIQFTVTQKTHGPAKVTHTTIAATDDKMAEGLNQIYGGMEQMVSGFFDTWYPFMIISPFPNDGSDYDLAEQGDLWSLSYKDGPSAHVVTTMTKGLLIRELKVNTPQFSSSIRPQFTESAKGMLLTGYQADYFGQSPSETTHLKVDIAYQTVNGFQLPQKLNLGGSYGGSPFQVEVTFSGCQASTR